MFCAVEYYFTKQIDLPNESFAVIVVCDADK